MSKITTFDRREIVFLYQQGAISWNLGKSQHAVQRVLKNLEETVRTKEKAAGLRNHLHQINSIWKSCP